MHIASIGIDLGKTTFHLVALDNHGKIVIKKKFSRKQLLAYTANLPTSPVGIEACSGAHFIGAALRHQGHDVRLIPAQFVKPFLKSNKNDFLDAEAIAEAVARKNMRFVPIKTDDQIDLRALHRVRDRLVHRRTALINQIRGFLLERGITFAKGPANLRNHMPAILKDAEQNLSARMRSLLDHLRQEWKSLHSDIERVRRLARAGRLPITICRPNARKMRRSGSTIGGRGQAYDLAGLQEPLQQEPEQVLHSHRVWLLAHCLYVGQRHDSVGCARERNMVESLRVRLQLFRPARLKVFSPQISPQGGARTKKSPARRLNRPKCLGSSDGTIGRGSGGSRRFEVLIRNNQGDVIG
jgi:hypothetical protein